MEQNKDVPPASAAKDAPGKITVPDKSADQAKAEDKPTYAATDPRSHTDLAPGEARLVASGPPVPDGPKAATPQEQAERRDAGIPEPPVPGPGSDLYLTTAGYVVVPSGVDPLGAEDPAAAADSRTRK